MAYLGRAQPFKPIIRSGLPVGAAGGGFNCSVSKTLGSTTCLATCTVPAPPIYASGGFGEEREAKEREKKKPAPVKCSVRLRVFRSRIVIARGHFEFGPDWLAREDAEFLELLAAMEEAPWEPETFPLPIALQTIGGAK